MADLKGFATSVEKQATKTGEKAGKNLSKGMSKSMGSSAKTGILQGLGLGAGLGAIGLVSSAVSQLTDVIGDSIKAFNEDQASQQKLRTALEANIPAWDGNTEAIEATIAARTKLGFSDDEQRDSLAELAVATGDVTSALAIQTTAMDLARFKRTSLAVATDALIKVESGQYKGLKALGIELRKGATRTEALAAVQKAAGGQAEDYANTNEGKVLVSQVKINEAMERLGSVLAGPVADGIKSVADFIEGDLVPALDEVIPLVKDLMDEEALGGFRSSEAASGPGKFFQEVSDNLLNLIDTLTVWDSYESQAIGRQRRMEQALEDEAEGVRELNRALITMVPRGVTAIGSLGGAFINEAQDAEEAKRRTIAATKRTTDFLTEAARLAIANYFDPLEQRYELRAVNAELADLREIESKKKLTREQQERQVGSPGTELEFAL